MSTIRRLSLPAHGAVELLIGIVLLTAPFVAALAPGALVVSVVAGALVVGVGLAGADALSPAAHQALDEAVVTVLLGLAVAMAIAGEPSGATLVGAAALGELLLVAGTRWTRPR
jgi:hypothetical protein